MLNKESERDEILATLKQNGILAIAFGPGMIRFVTHLDVHTADIERCCEILKSLRNH
jgi:4-aminobutyrate aminotransferase-like enzyme